MKKTFTKESPAINRILVFIALTSFCAMIFIIKLGWINTERRAIQREKARIEAEQKQMLVSTQSNISQPTNL